MPVQTTRDRLLQIGIRRMHSVGYTATGVQEILDEADVPKGSFYHYFPSKEAFTQEVLRLYVQGEVERCNKILGEKSVAPLKRLRRYFEELIRVYGPKAPVSGCLLGNMSLEMAAQSDPIQSLLHQSFANWQAGIAEVLREAIDRGELPKSSKPNELASFLLNSYQGALLRSKADRSNKPLEIFLHFTFTVLLKG